MTNLRSVSVVALVTVILWCAWESSTKEPLAAIRPFEVPEARPVSASYQDLAVACLALGVVDPAGIESDAARFESIVNAIGRVLEMHMAGDFDAFLQLHRSDLLWANERRSADVGQLEELLASGFGVSRSSAPDQWVDGLRMYWNLLYPEPEIAELDPSSSRVELRVEAVGAGGVDELIANYTLSFEKRRTASKIRINHAMAVPHRRTPEELADVHGTLTWFDYQVDLTLNMRERHACRILLRFVWDGMDGDWFLDRAVTSYPDHFDLGRSRSVLLL